MLDLVMGIYGNILALAVLACLEARFRRGTRYTATGLMPSHKLRRQQEQASRLQYDPFELRIRRIFRILNTMN